MDDDEALLAMAEQGVDEEPQPTPSPPPEVEQTRAQVKQQLRQSTLRFNSQPEDYLPALNEAQQKVVTYPATGSLQILAGPGSGTRALSLFAGVSLAS